jgi:hypothetical protein
VKESKYSRGKFLNKAILKNLSNKNISIWGSRSTHLGFK